MATLLAEGVDPDVTEGAWDQAPLVFAAANNRAEAVRVLLGAGADPNRMSRVIDIPEQAEADQAAVERLAGALEEFREAEGGGTDWYPLLLRCRPRSSCRGRCSGSGPDVPTEEEMEDPATEDAGDEESAEGEGKKNGEEAEAEEPEPPSYSELVHGWGAPPRGAAGTRRRAPRGGADIDLPSAGDETTPLLMAAINGQLDVALLLLERGADPNVANHAGTTPLYAAIDREWAATRPTRTRWSTSNRVRRTWRRWRLLEAGAGSECAARDAPLVHGVHIPPDRYRHARRHALLAGRARA